MKLFDDKRASYVRLFAAVDQLAASYSDLQPWPTDLEPESGEANFVSTLELPQGRRGDMTPEERSTDAASEVDEVLAIIELLAPLPVYEAGVTYSTAAMSNGPHLSSAFSIFVDCVRYDLGIDEALPPGWKRHDVAKTPNESSQPTARGPRRWPRSRQP
ncbi:hypothetical protein [Micromonospora ureilytica]|uniref:Uncharacterized protein n=1 Tax=Micromonospora ureilytica TaxID=709868 RepID=A0ABS0JM75_9ACTN|nr:hypothetical protein [Micromonospora ureilytica]MBG6068148.1 hypothetical protein [Micromonospora ureilytica]